MILVMDSTDQERLHLSKSELHKMLEHDVSFVGVDMNATVSMGI